MRLRSGDVLCVEALVEFYRGVDAAHDLCRPAGEATAPQRVCRDGRIRIGGFSRPGHRWSSRWEEEMIGWRRATAVLLLVLAGADIAAENAAVPAERPRLGEFIPSSPPVPAPTISLIDLVGNTVALS